MMHRCCFIFLLLAIAGCDTTRSAEDVRRAEMPKVRNIRPNVPGDKATLHVQAQTIFLRLDADVSEAWSLVGSDGLDAERVKLWQANGLRVGTMDAATASRFLAKLPPTGGAKQQTIGVGREPVVFETTPALGRAVEIEALLGLDRDETIRLPAGRLQLLVDVVLGKDAVTAAVTPHHHWVSSTVTPRTPGEKAMDGRVFKELSLDADLTGDRLLVIAWSPPPKKNIEKPAPAPTDRDAPADRATSPPTAPASPSTATIAAPPRATDEPAPPADPQPDPPSVFPDAPPKPKLGDVLLTGTRANRGLQLICIIRIPPQGEAIQSQPRPE